MTTLMRITKETGPLLRSLRVRTLSTASKPSEPPTKAPATTRTASQQEIAALRDEMRSLRTLLAQQNRDYDGLSRQVKLQSTQMSTHIEDIHEKVALMSAPLERITKVGNVLIENSEPFLKLVDQFERFSRGWINKYSLSAILAAAVTVWSYRAAMYERTSAEVAEIASRTLRQEGLQQTIQETLAVVANSPDTLETVNDLLQKILRDPLTLEELLKLVDKALKSEEVQKSVLSLVQDVLADPALQQQSGEHILKGLDTESAKKMLDLQTQALVRDVVSDKSVQVATAAGVRQSLWYSMIPSYFWPIPEEDDHEIEPSAES